MKIKIIVLFLLLSSCISLPKEIDSSFKDSCFYLKKDQNLLKVIKDLYVSGYLISSRLSYGRKSSVIGNLPISSKVKVFKILKVEDGSWGRFLRVQVKLLDGPFAGTIADIPVHAPYHPREKWTKNFTLDPNALEFNEDMVVPCD